MLTQTSKTDFTSYKQIGSINRAFVNMEYANGGGSNGSGNLCGSGGGSVGGCGGSGDGNDGGSGS